MRWRENAIMRYLSPTPKIILLGVVTLMIAGLVKVAEYGVNRIVQYLNYDKMFDFTYCFVTLFVSGFLIIIIAIIEKNTRSDARTIRYTVRHRLCAFSYGNPLHLRDGEIESSVIVKPVDNGGFRIRIECPSAKFEDVAKLESVISDSLRNKYGDYAVTSKSEDVAGRYVDYFIKNVVDDYQKQSLYDSTDDIPSNNVTRLYIRDEVYIDYSKVLNASTLLCGGTRSGKSTAAISTFLLPVLKHGADNYGSKVVVIDPKSAELSQCSNVLSPDINGSVEHILQATRDFNQTRIYRQQIINDEGKKRGKVIKWFEMGMHPCLLFLDEWISLVDLFPKKASKEKPDYSLSDFQGLIKQIATQGASAGCFLVISTGQASVGVGGLDSVVNNACGIRILFKPKRDDAGFIWNSKQIEVMRERDFVPGDAWYSIDDGIHNSVGFIKFPRMSDSFDEYGALSELMDKYYDN